MEVCRRSSGLLLLLGLSLLASTLQGVQGEVEPEGPSESECRPYIEKALKELETGEPKGSSEAGDSGEDIPTVEITTDDAERQPDNEGEDDNDTDEEGNDAESAEKSPTDNTSEQENAGESTEAAEDEQEPENKEETASEEQQDQPADDKQSEETADEHPSKEESKEEAEDDKESVEQADEPDTKEASDEKDETESKEGDQEESGETKEDQADTNEETDEADADSKEKEQAESQEGAESKEDDADTKEDEADTKEDEADTKEDEADTKEDESKEDTPNDSVEDDATQTADNESKEDEADSKAEDQDSKADDDDSKADDNDSKADDNDSKVDDNDSKAEQDDDEADENKDDSKADDNDSQADDDSKVDDNDSNVEDDSKEDNKEGGKSEEDGPSVENEDTKSVEGDGDDSKEKPEGSKEDSKEGDDGITEEADDESKEKESTEDSDSVPEEELSIDTEIPSELRPREHVEKLLKLDDESSETEKIINKVSEVTLKELKKLYENAIKPLEVLYKYRDLSNRHFGDAEIFSKPLILFMGPWSGGKSSIINYLVNNEYNETSLKTGAEPSPAYFNILMYGDEPEVIDGTELAADFTFSGLQKFGQGLEERLRGVKLPNKLLEKVNIVEIPGILEVRKQVSRVFPFNDACQWFIDRADIIFLVYDPSKLDVGPETEAILDQLKGREHQTRIILNKADQVKPEELMRVQGALIWNISPLMSSPQPPTMYTTSLWSRPYEPWAPVRLLHAQERAFLRDLRGAIDKRIENKIASARRFAVRVRNHAKMVDCYLTTYYNHKSVFGNRKQVADEIIEHPQDYHIYEGLSTLTNISRYDLPDPEVYKDFFKLNPLYDFQQLSATCTYFRGCPINRLDVAIAYDLPELVGTHKKLIENALAEAENQSTAAPGS